MKLAILFATLFAGAQVQAAVLADCTVTEVISSDILEESLSVEEYPEVTFSDYSAQLGASSYTWEEGARMQTPYIEAGKKLVLMVIAASGEERFELKIDLRTRAGELFHHTTNDSESQLLATLICK